MVLHKCVLFCIVLDDSSNDSFVIRSGSIAYSYTKKVDFAYDNTGSTYHESEPVNEETERENVVIQNIEEMNDNELVANKRGINVTAGEIKAKAKKNEGFMEYILNHKNEGDQILYQVKWIGYSSPTWEVEEYLTPTVLKEYLMKTVK